MRLILPMALLTLASGCTATGDYPSLAKRPFETATQIPAAPPPVAATPSDPAILARVSVELQKARASVPAFEEQLSKSRAQVLGGAVQGSESWITSQVAASRLEPLLAPAANAAASIGDEYRALMLLPTGSDLVFVEAALIEATAIADRQSEASAQLTAQINR